MLDIQEPTLVLDKIKCLINISRIVEKANQNKLIFRPHFKTHQSKEIGRWFRNSGTDKITVSSLNMALYFAEDGWKDITVAFPCNVLEIDKINKLASKVKLNLTVESVYVVAQLKKIIKYPVNLFIKIDIGYHRTGVRHNNFPLISQLINEIQSSELLKFAGFLGHAGHSYKSRSKDEIERIHIESLSCMAEVKQQYISAYPSLIISVGDTPTCSVMNDFRGVDEIRPGNLVFYDLSQWQIGSCNLDQIAVAMVCPIVSIHKDRNEIIIYGGSAHFSKDRIKNENNEDFFGYIVSLNDDNWDVPTKRSYVKSLSQEHGIVHADVELLENSQVGDIIGVIPVHSCLTSNLMKEYITFDGHKISRL